MKRNNALIELGFEEIPSSYLKPGIDIWVNELKHLLKKNGVEFEKIEGFYTPRRYVVSIKNVSIDNSEKEIEITGPSIEIAKKDGEWSSSASGFVKSQGKELNDLYIVKKGKREVVAIKSVKSKKSLNNIFKEKIKSTIESIKFPKMMVWENSKFKFARPIRWLLVIVDNSVVSDIKIADISSSNFTIGHGILNRSKIIVESPEKYFESIKNAYVIIDENDRRKIILESFNKFEKKYSLKIVNDSDLLDEVVGMVEYPVVMIGNFHNQYTELPDRVTATAMKQHQRYFYTIDSNGDIAPYFVVVLNMPLNKENILKNNETILKSKLEDAYFYYTEDLKVPIESRINMKKEIIWHRDLGTVYEKEMRIANLAKILSAKLDLGLSEELIRQISLHLKIDISTNMIRDGKEFTKLEGYMGKIYAEQLGINRNITEVIEEHMYPKWAGDRLPISDNGALFAICDRLDSLAGYVFKYGIPKGSKDPMGVRRALNGIIDITLDRKWNYDIMAIIASAFDNYNQSFNEDDIYNFVIERIKYFAQRENTNYDIINAVAVLKLSDIYDIILRARVLHRYRYSKTDEFNDLVVGQKRVANILKNVKIDNRVIIRLFKDEQEKLLYDKSMQIKDEIDYNIKMKNYVEVLNSYFSLRPDIDKFFDEVMVMLDDKTIRENRLGLMKHIRELFLIFADFSEIIIEGKNEISKK